jgi:hypothetical protein
MQALDFALEAKTIDEAGYIEGLAAGYGNVDHGGDIILPGALTKSISGRKAVPMLLFHDQKRPVGAWNEFEETSAGLMVRGRFAMKTTAGQEAHALAADGALSGLSIGYIPVRHKMTTKARELHELTVHEVSLVTVPMNERAQVTRVKSILEAGERPSVREFEDFLREAGFSKSLAVALAGKAAPVLRGEPETEANDPAEEFLRKLLG